MATLREDYDASHPEGNFGADLTLMAGDVAYPVHGRCHFSFETNTRFVSYLIAEVDRWIEPARVLLNNASTACDHAEKTVQMEMGNPTLGVPMRSSAELVFVGRMYLYISAWLDDGQKADLLAAGTERGLSIEIRDLNWLNTYNHSNRPVAFLSHDSRDKEEVARPLAIQLGKALCPVWFDEFSLKVGDSLTESIDRGIKEAAKCLVVLSPNFIENPGWSKAEFRAIMNRHIAEGAVILPVWHNVSRDEVYEFSSFLVDIVAANTRGGIEACARDLLKVLKANGPWGATLPAS